MAVSSVGPAMNTSAAAEKIPGAASGSTTRRSVAAGARPSARAASSSSGGACSSAARRRDHRPRQEQQHVGGDQGHRALVDRPGEPDRDGDQGQRHHDRRQRPGHVGQPLHQHGAPAAVPDGQVGDRETRARTVGHRAGAGQADAWSATWPAPAPRRRCRGPASTRRWTAGQPARRRPAPPGTASAGSCRQPSRCSFRHAGRRRAPTRAIPGPARTATASPGDQDQAAGHQHDRPACSPPRWRSWTSTGRRSRW